MKLDHFDFLLDGKSITALRAIEQLEPVDDVIFPPTYAPAQGDKEGGYQINIVKGKKAVTLDSVGSAGNRAERVFLDAPFNQLVPASTLTILAEDNTPLGTIQLLEATHHVADALLINSDHRETVLASLNAAFRGDYEPLAKLDPNSLLTGYWESRTNAKNKFPRIFKRTVDAYDVDTLLRGAQYEPSFSQDTLVSSGIHALAKEFGKKPSDLGFDSVPSPKQHGGVIVNGGIKGTSVLNLSVFRQIRSLTPDTTLALRRYILALGLVVLTVPFDGFLRQGCLLIRKPGTSVEIEVLHRVGEIGTLDLTPEVVLAYARLAAEAFGVGGALNVVVSRDTVATGLKVKVATDEEKAAKKFTIDEEAVPTNKTKKRK